ncbi:MAG: GYF domain-containing protein [Gemmataceae bacterium]|nr:GYF domain-containing protein [Gemmataceae bacterium]
MGQGWYYKRDGVERGPVPAAELKRLVVAGKLGPADVVRREDMEKWLPAGQVKGLFAAPVAATSATAMPPDPKPPRPAAARPAPRPKNDDEEPRPASPREERQVSRRKLGTSVIVGIAAGGVLLLGLIVTGAVLLLGGKKSGDQSVDAAKGGGGQGDGVAAVERSWSEYKNLDWKQKMSPDGLAVLPDGKTLAVCGKAVLLVDLDTGAETELEPPAKDSTTYYHIAAAPSGSLLAWYKYKPLDRVDETCGTRLWDSAQKRLHGRVVHTALNALGRPYSPTTHQYFSADGKTLVTSAVGLTRGKVSKDGTKVWDADSLKLRADVPGYGGRTQISADGKVLALHGAGFSSVILWDVEAGREKTTITVPRKDEQSVPGFVLHPDGKRLLTASTKGVLLWDAATGQLLREVADYGERRFRYLQFVFSPDGKKLAAVAQTTAGNAAVSSAKVWDLDSWAVATLRGKGTSSIKEFAFSPKGDLLVMAQYDNTLTAFKEEPGRGGKVAYREKDDEFAGASVGTPKDDTGGGLASTQLTKADFIKRLRGTAGPSKIGLQDGPEDWSPELRRAVGPIPGRAKPDSLHEQYSFPTKPEFLTKMGQPEKTETLREEVPFELVGSVATEALTYRCSDGRLRLEVSHSGWYTVLRVREVP